MTLAGRAKRRVASFGSPWMIALWLVLLVVEAAGSQPIFLSLVAALFLGLNLGTRIGEQR